MIRGPRQGEEWTLTSQPLVVGRSKECEIPIDDGKLSRRHARFFLQEGSPAVLDLGSSNGTFVNGKKISEGPCFLHPGDEIRMGASHFRLRRTEIPLAPLRLSSYFLLDILEDRGLVYFCEARRGDNDPPITLCILKPEVAEERNLALRFLEDGRIAMGIEHPNLRRILEAKKVDGFYLHVLEEIHAKPLLEWAKGRGPDLLPALFRLASQAADALEVAHTRGILHGDLCPGNLFVTEDEQVKVSGLAITQRYSVGEGTVSGNPAYLSPEASSGRPQDGRSDLYSLGACLFHVLTGSPPLLGKTPMETVERHASEVVPPIATLRPDIPEAYASVIDRLLAKNPEDRFQTGAEARDALREVIGNLPSESKAETAIPSPSSSPLATLSNLTPRIKVAWDSLLVRGIAVAVGILILAVVARSALSRSTSTTSSTSEDPAVLLAEADRIREQNPAEAQRRYIQIADRWPDDPAASQAKKRLRAMEKETEREEEKAAIEKAMAQYQEERKRPNVSYARLMAMLEQIRAELPAAKDAVEKEERALDQEGEKAIMLWETKLEEWAARGEYDSIFASFAPMRAQWFGHPALERLDAVEKAFRQRLEKTSRLHREQIQAYLKAKNYLAAWNQCRLFRQDVKCAEILPEIERYEKEIEYAFGRTFANLRDRVRIALRKVAFQDAKDTLRQEKVHLAGTPYEAKCEALTTLVEGVEKIHQRTLERIQQKKPLPAPASLPPKVALALGGTRDIQIFGASPTELYLRRGEKKTSVQWDALSGKPLADLWRLALSGDANEEERLIAQYEELLTEL